MSRLLCAFGAFGALVLFAAITACPPANPDTDPAVTRGRQVWMGTCIACHHIDPKVDGAVGPAVKGASRELIESKVLRGEYPAGYKPKRNTKVMPPQPAIAPSIDDLAAFLK